jgi:hypothetical protein
MPSKSSRKLEAVGNIFWNRNRILTKSWKMMMIITTGKKGQDWINPLYNSNKSNCGAKLTTERIILLCYISNVNY